MKNLTPTEAEQQLARLCESRPDITDANYLAWIQEVAKTRAQTHEGIKLRKKAKIVKDLTPGSRGLANFIGVMLRAKGY